MASLCISACEPQVSALRSCLDSLRDATGPAASGGPALDAAGCMAPLVAWKECCEDAKVRARESAPPPPRCRARGRRPPALPNAPKAGAAGITGHRSPEPPFVVPMKKHYECRPSLTRAHQAVD
jgi:hypothetical protein